MEEGAKSNQWLIKPPYKTLGFSHIELNVSAMCLTSRFFGWMDWGAT
jgi:hypothetical protein